MKRNTAMALLVIAVGAIGVSVSVHYQLRGLIVLHIPIFITGVYFLIKSTL